MTPQDRLITAIEAKETLASAYGSLQDEREDALNRYYGKPYGDEIEGRSQVVMRDVADTVEWIKPSLMKVFASGDEVVRFDPVGPEDIKLSEQETEYCNHLLMNRNPGFLILHDWFHDALLQKNGYVWVSAETEQRPALEQYRNLTDDEFALVARGDVQVVGHAAYTDEAGVVRHDASVRKLSEYHCLRVRNIPPERVLVDSEWPGVSLRGCPFVEVIERKTISDLRQEGHDVDDEIDDSSGYNEDKYIEDRRSINANGWSLGEKESADPTMRVVRVRYVWMRYDEDGDGIAELRRIVLVGKTILEDEEDNVIPIACLTPYRIPHEHYGQSVADAVDDLQRIRTVLMRGFLDNVYLANNGRNAVDATRVNLDDLLVSRPGGIVRVQGDPGSAVFPLVQPSNGAPILQAVEMVDSIRENRTGVTKYNQGLDANSLNKTAHGIQQIMTAAQQRIDLVARIFAETGVKELFLLLHGMSIKNGRQPELVRLRNEWVPIDPRQWQSRFDATVSVGLGTGNKDQMLQHLIMILQAQKEGLSIGIASPENIYNAATKLTQNAGFKQVEEFWTDPKVAGPQQPQPSPEQVKAQAQLQQEQLRLQADAQKFQAQSALDQQRMQAEAQQKELDRQLELEKVRMQEATKLEIAKLREHYAAQIEITREQARQQPVQAQFDDTNLRETVGQATAGNQEILQSLVQTMQALTEAMSRPKQLIRGPDGRAIGVQ